MRRKDHNVVCAIAAQSGEIEYYTRGFYSLTTSTDKDFASNSHSYIKKETTAKRLDDVLRSSTIAEKQIDFLSIDAEGNDFEVLRSLNFEVYQPTVVAIESNKTTFEEVSKTKEYVFLRKIGYDLVA